MESSLVRYIASQCRMEIDGYTEYVDKVSKCIQEKGMVDNMLSEPAYTKKVAPLSYSEGRRISYEIVYSNSICGISYTWYINMDFFEKSTGTELRINITSQTYIISIEDEYFTRLTQVVEECIKKDWRVLVKVVDAYGDMLNMILFPELHRIENTARRVVNGLMSRVYSAMWFKENNGICNNTGKECSGTDKVKNSEYAVFDNTVIMMSIADFDRVITQEWDCVFSRYFSQDFRYDMHKLAQAYTKVLNNYCSDKEFYIDTKRIMESVNKELVNVLWKIENFM